MAAGAVSFCGTGLLGLVSLGDHARPFWVILLGCLVFINQAECVPLKSHAVFLGLRLPHTCVAQQPKDGASVCFRHCPQHCRLPGDRRQPRTFRVLISRVVCVC